MKKTTAYIVSSTNDNDYTLAFTSLNLAAEYIYNMLVDGADFSTTTEEILTEMKERDAHNKVYRYIKLVGNEEMILCFATTLNDTRF